MTAFLWGNLMGTCHCKISACPQTNILRQGSSRTGHKVRDALKTCELHVIAELIGLLLAFLLCRCTACQQALNHKLQETILRRQLCTASECNLPNLVHCIAVLLVLTGQAHRDVVLTQPL